MSALIPFYWIFTTPYMFLPSQEGILALRWLLLWVPLTSTTTRPSARSGSAAVPPTRRKMCVFVSVWLAGANVKNSRSNVLCNTCVSETHTFHKTSQVIRLQASQLAGCVMSLRADVCMYMLHYCPSSTSSTSSSLQTQVRWPCQADPLQRCHQWGPQQPTSARVEGGSVPAEGPALRSGSGWHHWK